MTAPARCTWPLLLLLLTACTPAALPAADECAAFEADPREVASTSNPAAAPVLEFSDTPVSVTMAEGSYGFVGLRIDDFAKARISLRYAGLVDALFLDDDEIALPTPASNPSCPLDIVEVTEIGLAEAGVYTLRLDATQVTPVRMLYTHAP